MYSFVTPLIADTFICFGIGISLIKEPVELTTSVEDTADVFFNALADDELAAALLLLLVAVSGPAPRYVRFPGRMSPRPSLRISRNLPYPPPLYRLRRQSC